KSLADLRGMTALALLDAAQKNGGQGRFSVNVDGYFFKEPVAAIFTQGKQAQVPLLAGWNADEMNFRMVMGREAPSAATFAARVGSLYGEGASAVLKAYPAETDEQAKRAAQDLASDRFIASGTWKWIEVHSAKAPVWRYRFDQVVPGQEANG